MIKKFKIGKIDFNRKNKAVFIVITMLFIECILLLVPIWSIDSNKCKFCANTINKIAEGNVKAKNANMAPSGPARIKPIAKPNCELAGPGKNWQMANTCEN